MCISLFESKSPGGVTPEEKNNKRENKSGDRQFVGPSQSNAFAVQQPKHTKTHTSHSLYSDRPASCRCRLFVEAVLHAGMQGRPRAAQRF
jgi:hypothetical protein